MKHALLISQNAYGGAAKQMAYASRRAAPKGASNFEELTARLKPRPFKTKSNKTKSKPEF
jgi:hypothetical protein